MELWTFQRYREPRLCVDAIDHDAGSAVVSLRSRGTAYRIAFDHADAAGQIAAELRSLADSGAPLWQTLRTSTPDSGWHALGTFLDTHSLIGEGRDGAADALAEQRAHIDALVEGTVEAIVAPLPPARRERLAADARTLRATLDRTSATGHAFEPGGDPFDAAVQPNFYLALLAIEFEYFRRLAPLTLAACERLLARFAGAPASAAAERALSDAAGLYDLRDLGAHLWLVGHALAAAGGDTAARYPVAPLPEPALCNGLEYMRQVELVTRDTLAGWGENPYVAAIDRLAGAYAPLVAGQFIEQYHVTTRFVEIIAPLLSMRLAPSLRAQMFRYYGEEYGHEVFESTTCAALGVAPPRLAQAMPLPLHFAFVDALTLTADLDPVTSFAAIMVIEGIYGEPPRMSLRLDAAARGNTAFREVSGEHEEINESHNHNSISRDLFAHIDAIGVERQALTTRRILFLLELNQRAWGGIAQFYGPQTELRLHGPFGRPLSPT